MLIAWFCLLLLAPFESGIDWFNTEIPANSGAAQILEDGTPQPPPKAQALDDGTPMPPPKAQVLDDGTPKPPPPK